MELDRLGHLARPKRGLQIFVETALYQGKTLLELWQEHQELFGHPNEQFPVIISLVGPEDDLSIQVHPDVKAALVKLSSRQMKFGILLKLSQEPRLFMDTMPKMKLI